MGRNLGFGYILAHSTDGFLHVFTFVQHLLPGLLQFWFLLRHGVIEIVA